MNKEIMKKMGFEKEVRMAQNNVCPICCKPIVLAVDPPPFRDQLSWKEFSISGMCQKCQDDVFGV